MNFDWISDLPVVRYPAGKKLIAEGSRPDRLFFLKEGKVEIIRGETRVALVKTPGSVLGEMSLLLDSEATADVVAMGDATVHVTREPLELLRTNPDLLLHVARTVAFRLKAATDYLTDVKEQLAGCSDHVGMVDGVLDAIIHRDLKKRIPSQPER